MGGTIWVDSRPEGGASFSFTIPMATQDSAVAEEEAATREASGGLLLLHRMTPGAIPGEGELVGWGYRTAVTTTADELQHTLEEGEPFACVVSAGNEIAAPLQQIGAAASLAGDRAPWFLFAHSTTGASIPLGRVVPIGEHLGPRAVVRLMRALDSFPPGRRILFVDPEDRSGAYWVHDTLDQRGLRVIPATQEEIARLTDGDDVVVLLLDLTSDPVRALELWRDVAIEPPAWSSPCGIRGARAGGGTSVWTRRSARSRRDFEAGSAPRLRWTLNAIHTCASQGRMAGWNGFAAEASDTDAKCPLPRPRRPILVVEDHPGEPAARLPDAPIARPSVPVRRERREALEAARRECPSLVLMDIQMPDMDGYQVTRAIHRSAGREHVPVVAMTAHVGPEDRRSCHEAGCIDFLPKPIERGDLVRMLRRWLPAAGEGSGPGSCAAGPSLRRSLDPIVPGAIALPLTDPRGALSH